MPHGDSISRHGLVYLEYPVCGPKCSLAFHLEYSGSSTRMHIPLTKLDLVIIYLLNTPAFEDAYTCVEHRMLHMSTLFLEQHYSLAFHEPIWLGDGCQRVHSYVKNSVIAIWACLPDEGNNNIDHGIVNLNLLLELCWSTTIYLRWPLIRCHVSCQPFRSHDRKL